MLRLEVSYVAQSIVNYTEYLLMGFRARPGASAWGHELPRKGGRRGIAAVGLIQPAVAVQNKMWRRTTFRACRFQDRR